MARLFVLGPHQIQRFYRGGSAIASFRGLDVAGDGPEDWIASTTTVFGEPALGLTRLPDGRLLADAVEQDPEWFLGPEHLAAYGADTCLLVKLLDAGERLPVHCHPDRAYGLAHLDCPHGKTEAWVVIGVSGADPRVYLGFREPVPAEVLAGWVARQDVTSLVESLHQVPVQPGDSILVPAGTPHAIGAGVFVVELQEPTDLSVLLEWQGFVEDGARQGSLGLGYQQALDSVDRSAWPADRLAAVRRSEESPGSAADVARLFPPAADPFFRAERLRPRGRLDVRPGYAVWIVTDGRGTLRTQHGGDLELRRGMTVLVPHADGPARLSGDLEVVRCLPPSPAGAPGRP
jgi:mannose-6-phosphate isomerase